MRTLIEDAIINALAVAISIVIRILGSIGVWTASMRDD